MATLGGIRVDGRAIEVPHQGCVGSIRISPADIEHFGAVVRMGKLVTYSGPVEVHGMTANRTVVVRVTGMPDAAMRVTFEQNAASGPGRS